MAALRRLAKRAAHAETPEEKAQKVAEAAALRVMNPTITTGADDPDESPDPAPSAERTPEPYREERSMSNPFQIVIDAADSAAQGYSPENARIVLDCIEHMPEAVDAMARLFTTVGQKNTEDFHVDPAAGEYLLALGGQFQRFHEPVAHASEAFMRAHAADIERINEPQPNQEKWDISANRD